MSRKMGKYMIQNINFKNVVLFLFLIITLGLFNCADIDEMDFLEIWDETVQCYSDFLNVDINEVTTIPDFFIVDFQVCPDIEGNTNGCTWVQEAKEGDKIDVGRKGNEIVTYTVGEEIPLHHLDTDITGKRRTYVVFVLEEEGKNYEGLTYHEVTHGVLGQIFKDAGSKNEKRDFQIGFGDGDSNHDSIFFNDDTSPCRFKWKWTDILGR